jgi:imidazolonepropionase-like amidohydrolase
MLRQILPLLALLPAAAHAETLYVRAGRLVDPEAGRVLTAQVLKVEDGRVVSVQADRPLPAGAKVVDWSGFTVLPGLIDCHVHLADVEQSSNVAEPLLHSAMEIGFIGARNARKTLLAGFTSVHDVGSFRAYADV